MGGARGPGSLKAGPEAPVPQGGARGRPEAPVPSRRGQRPARGPGSLKAGPEAGQRPRSLKAGPEAPVPSRRGQRPRFPQGGARGSGSLKAGPEAPLRGALQVSARGGSSCGFGRFGVLNGWTGLEGLGQLHLVASAALGLIQGGVGRFHQFRLVGRIGGIGGDPMLDVTFTL